MSGQRTLIEVRKLANELQVVELEIAKARTRLVNAIRNAEGVSQSDLARAAGISRQRVSQLMNEDAK